jgi:hypothetical protein
MKTLWCKNQENPSDRISHAWAPLSTNMIKNVFFQNAIWVSKNAEFDADFESVEKIAKRLSYQRNIDRKMEFFTFITASVQGPLSKGFRPSWTNFFAFFPPDSNSASSFAFCNNNILFLQKQILLEHFAILKSQTRTKRLKKRKTHIINLC